MPWMDPNLLDPPHAVTNMRHMCELGADMIIRGWQGPPVIGYYLNGRLQLLSGSHRHAAAKSIAQKMPVRIVPYSVVQAAWGNLESWLKLMET